MGPQGRSPSQGHEAAAQPLSTVGAESEERDFLCSQVMGLHPLQPKEIRIWKRAQPYWKPKPEGPGLGIWGVCPKGRKHWPRDPERKAQLPPGQGLPTSQPQARVFGGESSHLTWKTNWTSIQHTSAASQSSDKLYIMTMRVTVTKLSFTI